jgi:hypothetical protein
MADLELKVTIPYTFNVKAAPVQPVTVAPGSSQVILVPVPGGKGDKGDTGPAGNNTPVFSETPAGNVDGANTVFGLAHPYQSGSVRIFLNGLHETHFTETTSTTITFADPPLGGDEISVDYLIA